MMNSLRVDLVQFLCNAFNSFRFSTYLFILFFPLYSMGTKLHIHVYIHLDFLKKNPSMCFICEGNIFNKLGES